MIAGAGDDRKQQVGLLAGGHFKGIDAHRHDPFGFMHGQTLERDRLELYPLHRAGVLQRALDAIAQALRIEPPRAIKSPAAVEQHAHAEALRGALVEILQAVVLGEGVFAAGFADPDVGVAGAVSPRGGQRDIGEIVEQRAVQREGVAAPRA